MVCSRRTGMSFPSLSQGCLIPLNMMWKGYPWSPALDGHGKLKKIYFLKWFRLWLSRISTAVQEQRSKSCCDLPHTQTHQIQNNFQKHWEVTGKSMLNKDHNHKSTTTTSNTHDTPHTHEQTHRNTTHVRPPDSKHKTSTVTAGARARRELPLYHTD